MVSIPSIMLRTLQELPHLVLTTILWKMNYNYLYFTYEEYIIIIYIWHMSKWNLRKSNSFAWITDAGTWVQVFYCWTVAFNHYGILYFQHGFHPWVGKMPWSKKWQSAPVFLPGKFHGQRSLGGSSPWGCKELDTTEWLNTHTGGTSGKEPTWQCRRHKRCQFDPWVRKISWKRTWQLTLLYLLRESYGHRSLESYSPEGPKEADRSEAT